MPTLKLSAGKPAARDTSPAPPTPSGASVQGAGASSFASGSGFKIKLGASQPPTPASEQAPRNANAIPSQQPKVVAEVKQRLAAEEAASSSSASKPKGKSGNGAGGKKRAAGGADISPAAKRLARGDNQSRRVSLKIPSLKKRLAREKEAGGDSNAQDGSQSAAGFRIPLKRKSTVPKLRSLTAKKQPPPRLPGHGYDSEDSEAELDPAILQNFILRMQPGEDCDYLREAIANGKVGLPIKEGGADVSLRFLDKDGRRAAVTVRGKMYAAALVELPCIVETMKSWDRKGWWKVADVSQMLLVLGRCASEEEARTFPLPREVDKNTLQFPHGLTPPMHWVRKRRFRKRVSYKTIANVEEEVERLLREDELCEAQGGEVILEYSDGRAEQQQSQEPEPEQPEEDGEAMETVENDGEEYDEEYYSDTDAAADLEDNLQAMFDEDHAAALISDSPAPLVDPAASTPTTAAAAVSSQTPTTENTPAATPAQEGLNATSEESDEDASGSDDDDDDDDAESPDFLDEDAAARAAERAQQLEEVADLEREVEMQRMVRDSTNNRLLKERAITRLRVLEEDLRVKRAVFGLDDEDGEDDDGEGGGGEGDGDGGQ